MTEMEVKPVHLSIDPDWIGAMHYDPFGLMAGSPAHDFERSARKILRTPGIENPGSAFEKMQKVAAGNIAGLFPTREEFIEELIPIMDPFRDLCPFYRMGLSISSPIAFPNTISFNLITRFYTADRKLRIKIRIGIFADPGDKIYYEVGFVDTQKSVNQFEKNFMSGRSERGDFFTLQKLVAQVREFLKRRPVITGLDLTPANYHVLPLCLRLGAIPQEPDSWLTWYSDMKKAVNWSLCDGRNKAPDLFHQYESVHSRYLVSWMFQTQQIFQPGTNQVFPWSPPRLVDRIFL